MKEGDHQSSEFTMTGPLSKTQTDRPRPSGDRNSQVIIDASTSSTPLATQKMLMRIKQKVEKKAKELANKKLSTESEPVDKKALAKGMTRQRSKSEIETIQEA